MRLCPPHWDTIICLVFFYEINTLAYCVPDGGDISSHHLQLIITRRLVYSLHIPYIALSGILRLLQTGNLRKKNSNIKTSQSSYLNCLRN